MKILLTGRAGQIGYELERNLQGLAEIIAVDRQQMDLADLRQVREVIRAIKPQLIINTAAYTDVDGAERESELAMRINGDAPGVMAEEAKRLGAGIIHYSTDYIFDGAKKSPYVEDDIANPINSYGRSKFYGEQFLASVGVPYLVLRTSWIYGLRRKNFLTTMLRLAKERSVLRVVSDQCGAPTWCRTVAEATGRAVVLRIMGQGDDDWGQARSGIYHLAAQGETTWFEFAQHIMTYASVCSRAEVIPIGSYEYSTPAARPANSVMDCGRFTQAFGTLPVWDEALRQCLCKA